jgi:hypothetical protein
MALSPYDMKNQTKKSGFSANQVLNALHDM